MNMDEFRDLLAAWGADPGRWPDDRRIAAEALLELSAEARMVLADEAAFDALLTGAPEATPSAALMQSILAIPRATGQERAAGGWLSGFTMALPRFAGLAAAAVMGFYIGTTSLFQPAGSMASDRETVDISDYVFGDSIDAGSGEGET